MNSGSMFLTSFFTGRIDDVLIYNRALSAEEIVEIYRDGLGGKAFWPDPANGAADVDPDVVLSWAEGLGAISHDVYFGTDYNDVNEADDLSDEYQDTVDVNSWDPCGLYAGESGQLPSTGHRPRFSGQPGPQQRLFLGVGR